MGSVTNVDDYGREGASSKDIEVIRAYGAQHPDAWVDVWAQRDPDFHLVASFFGEDVSEHERQLRQRVSRPDRLRVHRATWPLSHLEAIRQEILDEDTAARPRRTVQRVGITMGIVNVTLAPDQEEYAARLTRAYGDAIDIMVGSFHYPDRGPDPIYARVRDASWSHARPVVAPPPELPSSVHVALGEPAVVVSGQMGAGTLIVTNHGGDDLVLNTNGWVTASVIDPATGDVVGGFSGAQITPLIRFPLPVGEPVNVPMQIATTSSRPELGYAIPAGAWALRVPLEFEGVGRFVTPLLALTITARDAAAN